MVVMVVMVAMVAVTMRIRWCSDGGIIMRIRWCGDGGITGMGSGSGVPVVGAADDTRGVKGRMRAGVNLGLVATVPSGGG